MSIIIRTAKRCWISFWAAFATVVVFLPIVISSLVSSTGNFAFVLSQLWAWIILKTTWVRVTVRGKENIMPGVSYIIISNHQSDYDALALALKLSIQFRWIAKKELRKIPLFGYALYAARNIMIDRSNRESAMASIRAGVNRLPPATSVLFFAEGTRSPDGAIHPFKKGGFITAIETGMPILPVTVNGSRRIMPKRSLVFYPGTVELVIGTPIETKEYTLEHLEDLIAKTRDTIIDNFNPNYPEGG